MVQQTPEEKLLCWNKDSDKPLREEGLVVVGGLISTQPECQVIRGDLSDLFQFQVSSFSSSPFHIAPAEALFQTSWTKTLQQTSWSTTVALLVLLQVISINPAVEHTSPEPKTGTK